MENQSMNLLGIFIVTTIGFWVGHFAATEKAERAMERQAIERGYGEFCGDGWAWVGECKEGK
jgi:hypothetical protein